MPAVPHRFPQPIHIGDPLHADATRKAGMTTTAELRHEVLKLLVSAGTYGRLQKHIFERLPTKRTAALIDLLRGLESDGLITKRRTTRSTTRWANLWTITAPGRELYLQSAAPSVTQEPLAAMAGAS